MSKFSLVNFLLTSCLQNACPQISCKSMFARLVVQAARGFTLDAAHVESGCGFELDQQYRRSDGHRFCAEIDLGYGCFRA